MRPAILLFAVVLALIHRSAWKWNSPKFICRIAHRSPSERREDGFLGPPRHVSEIYILWWCMKMQAEEYSGCGERPLFCLCMPSREATLRSK